MSESSSAADQVSVLINKGRPKEARQLAQRFLNESPNITDANFFFQYALAEQMTGNRNDLFRQLWKRASECGNYTVTMEGDFYRDWALAELRHGNITKSERLLKEARSRHIGDINREAVIVMVEARITFSDHDYDESVRLHRQAELMWTSLGSRAHKQWVKNNQFHQLRAVTSSTRHSKEYKELLYKTIVQNDDSRNHRIGAWLARYLGRFGNAVYDFIAKYLG
ncbi:MAG TPA: hypothetical protein VFS65_01735 [Candidatus Saccharimonadales bacterium]|nr:hypothetical protein [Candidatus Saccharimonadales bacterium]